MKYEMDELLDGRKEVITDLRRKRLQEGKSIPQAHQGEGNALEWIHVGLSQESG